MVKCFCMFLLVSLTTHAQQIRVETKFSEQFAVFEFINSLSSKTQANVFRKLFNQSAFNTKTYTDLIAQFDSLNIGYSFDFPDYPAGEKIGIDVPFVLRRNFILSGNLPDFKLRSMDLVPNEALLKLTALVQAFTPVYEEVIYKPAATHFQEQLKGITKLANSGNLNVYFSEAVAFYNSSWDPSIPFVFCFYPLPHSRGFTATAIGNVALSAIADSLDDYRPLLSVMMHEICHILYDERSRSLWNQTDAWFTSNPSRNSRYAYSLFNEAMASAVGNGYIGSLLNGKEDTSRRLYGQQYINAMAKAAYPLVKEYIAGHHSIDSVFITRYMQLFDAHFAGWLADVNYLMTGSVIMSENSADFDYIDRNYRYHGHEHVTDISLLSLEKLKTNHATKMIIVNRNNGAQLALVKSGIPELSDWHFDAGQDFSYAVFLQDKSYLFILNNIRGTTPDKFKDLATILPH